MGSTRRTVLAAGAVAAATAAAPRVFAQPPAKTGTGKFYERGPVRIYFEEAGAGVPLLLIPGGGLNSTIAFFTGNSPFNAIEEFKGEYRCIAAAVLAQPVGWRPEMPDPKYPGTFWRGWPAQITAKRPDVPLQTAEQFVTRMFETNPDFVFTVTRDFVRACQNPILVLPDDVPAHPLAVAMECAMLAPRAEVSIFPWKQPKERIPLAVRQIHPFLKAHRPA